MAMNLPHPGLLLTIGGYFGLLFAATRFRNSSLGLAFVFALTGFMGLHPRAHSQRLSGPAQR